MSSMTELDMVYGMTALNQITIILEYFHYSILGHNCDTQKDYCILGCVFADLWQFLYRTHDPGHCLHCTVMIGGGTVGCTAEFDLTYFRHRTK